MHPPATIGSLAIQVLERNARAFEDHQPGVREGADPTHVHQMRVATRRMRAALRLFGDVLPAQATSLNNELAWIAGLLGARRDLDVQVGRLRDRAAELGLAQALVPFGDWLEEQRRRAQAELTSALDSARFAQVLDQLHRLGEWPLSPEVDPPLEKDAPRRLRRIYRKLRKRARPIDAHAAAPVLHKARIAAKRVRYAAEFFEAVYGKPAKRLVKRLVSLQDLLGELQDGVVSRQRIHRAVQTEAGAWPAETSLALGRAMERDAQRAAQIRQEFPRLDRAVKDEWRAFRRSLK
ncbi:MAG: CHAD domain-containing protein [Chloroflexi bacterium]|nr:CHAD domain-containing protein [Chloroflexota bacterium]